MEQDKVLSKVRGLLAKWEALGDDSPEGKACKEKADAMMHQYSIDQATLRDSMPVAEQQKPDNIMIDLVLCGSPYERPVTQLVMAIAAHCRCQVVFMHASMDGDLIAIITRYQGKPPNVQAKVFGFESDLQYFEMLFTVLHLHMASGYDPKIDPALSDEDNAYALHNAGLNWRAIARLYYPTGHRMGWDGVIKPDGGHLGRAGAYWKSCYTRAIRAKGEPEIKLPKFSDSDAGKVVAYRHNFAMSYVSTVRRRLEETRASRNKGGELVLASSASKIRDFIEDMFPSLSSIEWKSEPGYNPNAWSAGSKHGREADLNANARMGGPHKELS